MTSTPTKNKFQTSKKQHSNNIKKSNPQPYQTIHTQLLTLQINPHFQTSNKLNKHLKQSSNTTSKKINPHNKTINTKSHIFHHYNLKQY